MPYLFSHFKEKLTPDGEAVYLASSEDGRRWRPLNDGAPLLTASLGQRGCRDIELCRLTDGSYVCLTTDLCVARERDDDGSIDWRRLNHSGSKFLRMWRSPDLRSFSPETMLDICGDDIGCAWAPEIFYDDTRDEYLIHWSSTVAADGYSHMTIRCCTTRDFIDFSEPRLFFEKTNEILDSHIVKQNGRYHLFYKNSDSPAMVMLAVSDSLYGPYRDDPGFASFMSSLDSPGAYEGPTSFFLPDGRFCLLLDFFGCEPDKMGYVPFIASDCSCRDLRRAAEGEFSFPYGLKHGRALYVDTLPDLL